MKKFEPYIDGKKIGTINVNFSALKKKYAAGVLAVVMTVTTMSGCTFENAKGPESLSVTTSKNYNVDPRDEIEKKEYFVNEVLSELNNAYEKNGNTLAKGIYNKIMDSYKDYTLIDYKLNLNNKDEYFGTLTHSSLAAEQQKKLAILNDLINYIETNTNWKFGKNFLLIIYKGEEKYPIKEEIDEKFYFVNQVLNELKEMYINHKDTLAENVYNQLLNQYIEYVDNEENIEYLNDNELSHTTIFNEFRLEDEKMLQILNDMIYSIENLTSWDYGKDFILEKSIDDTKEKTYFINKVFNELEEMKEKDEPLAGIIYNELMERYKEFINEESDIKLTDEDLSSHTNLLNNLRLEPEELSRILTKMIIEIETKTAWKYRENFQLKNKNK